MSDTIANIVRTNDRHAPTAALHVEVIADLICPFCYLGKRRLDEALEAVQGPREVSWYPYQLNPEMAAEGMAFEDYLSQRFGGRAYVEPALEQFRSEGRPHGIDFRFDRLTRVPNTMLAHQLMYLAELEGADTMALADDLMTSYFTRGENLGDVEVLIAIAARHGMEKAAVIATIDDDKSRQVVQAREAQVRASGIAGVPGFLLNRRLLMVGAQSTDDIVNAFDRAMFGEGNDAIVSPALH